MKVLCVVTMDPAVSKASGEMKKFLMQKNAFEENGLQTEIQYLKPVSSKNRVCEKIARRLLTYKLYSSEDMKNICANCANADAVYIRKEKIDSVFIQMLKGIRQACPVAKIILEIPTYPYDKEFSRIVDKPFLWKERWYRRKFRYYVDRIVILSDEQEIFGVKCIKIDNGFDFERVPLRQRKICGDKVIRLIGVATLAPWHGYDRVIQGLGEYYKEKLNRKVEFHIIGDGRIAKDLKELCRKWEVEQYVYFHSWMHGKELDDMFDLCDIGVGSLGMHRIGFENGNTLKLREYVARGIPFFYGYVDELIASSVNDFTMQIPNNDSSVDIHAVIHFYDEMNEKGFDKIAWEMREQAEKNLSWIKQMKPVADYILSDNK